MQLWNELYILHGHPASGIQGGNNWGTPTGHGRAWAESGLEDQGSAEELGRAEKEEEIGELAGAGRLKVVKEGRGGMPGDNMGSVRITGVGESGFPYIERLLKCERSLLSWTVSR